MKKQLIEKANFEMARLEKYLEDGSFPRKVERVIENMINDIDTLMREIEEYSEDDVIGNDCAKQLDEIIFG